MDKTDRLSLRFRSKSRRSKFAIWLSDDENYASMVRLMKTFGPSWQVTSEWVADEFPGSNMSPEAVKQAFHREKVRRAWNAVGKSAAPVATTPAPASTGARERMKMQFVPITASKP